jgi:hypothetical protein
MARLGEGLLAGGRQLRGVLMRLVNAKDASAVRGLTSLAEAVSTAPDALGSGHPRGDPGASPGSKPTSSFLSLFSMNTKRCASGIGLGILRAGPSHSQQAGAPIGHLENARRDLRLALLRSRSYHARLESPVHTRSEESARADSQKHRSGGPSAKVVKYTRSGPLESVDEDPGISSGSQEIQMIRKVISPSGVRCARLVSRFPSGALWSITMASGTTYSLERYTVDDSQTSRILENKLKGLRHIRGLQGVTCVEAFEDRKGKEKYSLLVCGLICRRRPFAHFFVIDHRNTWEISLS